MHLFLCVTLAVILFISTFVSHSAWAGEPTFEDYPSLPMYWGERHPAGLSQNMCRGLLKEEWCPWDYRNRIRAADESQVNFNGAFTLTSWKHSAVERRGVIIDRSDPKGTTYKLPDSVSGYQFRLNSSMLIVNPKLVWSAAGSEDLPLSLWRKSYTFTNGKFVQVWQDRGEGDPNASPLDTPHPVDPQILEDLDTEGDANDPPLTRDELKEWCGDHPERQCPI